MSATLAILAGGSGTRMGMPKSHLTIEGKPVLEHILDTLAWTGPTMLVTAPGVEHPPGHQRFKTEVTDPKPGEGPLRGILTALEAGVTGTLLIATVDMPKVTREQLDWLDKQFQLLEHSMALACKRTPEKDSIEPFPCALRDTALEPIRRLLAMPHHSAKSFFQLPGTNVMQAPEDWPPSVWLNLNRPEDLDLLGA